MDETVRAFEADATFDGAAGTVKCNSTDSGNDCMVTLNAKGEITLVTGDLDFTHADGAKVDVADADHLSYGFWLKRTTDEDGVLTYDDVETFVKSSVLILPVVLVERRC